MSDHTYQHQPANAHVREVVTQLLERGRAPEVERQRLLGFLGRELAADGIGAKVVRVVRHARVFPVDERDAVILSHQKVQMEEVVMAQACVRFVSHREIVQPLHARGHILEAGNVDDAAALAQ